VVTQVKPQSASWCVPSISSHAEEHLLLIAEILVHTGEELDIPSLCCWTCQDSFYRAEMQACRDEEWFSLYCWRWPATSRHNVGASSSFQANTANDLAYDGGALWSDLSLSQPFRTLFRCQKGLLRFNSSQ